MHLILDIGNTRIKHFVYKESALIESKVYNHQILSQTLLETKQNGFEVTHILIADVWGKAQTTVANVFPDARLLICSLDLKMPFTTSYQSKTTLGADRIALLVAIFLAYPKKNVLGIDLGSCITYDLLDAKGHHHGGSISPGFKMRYKSLHAFTGKLPKLDPKWIETPLGNNTQSAIHAGVYHGILNEIEGQIKYYSTQFKNLTVIFMGGDAQRLPMPYKNGIFAPDNFSADGLRHILEINS